ncbi:chemotaxis protein CheX [Geomonas sp. Red69]|uniref:Chemotaxis protein CheX n=1 Tax=Geomonas diazotrophica TaxID=2843197 RepID=A0ABX8JJ18_9BACT|nr:MULTISPECIES: chemotaxis protein CheX [Geomonas]MBU5635306.1 chemotaxis protein CheX [Geomonas diazotrophica]QWV97634.1 chemotaxis protein CheX [Geomonas nitrogeniifigens]QXE86777.1 chemotaxis protein CheX [Geomonas nitrogeniifigens]
MFSDNLLATIGTSGPVLEKTLIQEVRKIFSTMMGMDHLLHLPLAVNPASNFTDCISALVGLAGEYNGLVGLHVSTQLAQRLAGQLLDTEEPSEEEVEDALGELANVLAGDFKRHLSPESLAIRLSTPSIVSGKQYAIHVSKKPEVMTLLFDSEDDWFMVALAVEQ